MYIENFILYPLKAEKKSRIFCFRIFYLSILILCGCHRNTLSSSLEEKTKILLTRFFSELLLDHGGMYTLCGHKPLTIESIYYYSKEDMQRIEKFLKDHPEIESRQIERYLDETWPCWKELSKDFKMKNFIIAEIHPEEFSEKESLILFINIKETLSMIQQYYDDFRSAYCKDFQPLEVIESLKKGEDDFWQVVFKHKALLGILLGYGYNNSWLFKLKNNGCESIEIDNSDSENVLKEEKKYSIEGKALTLPTFAQMNKKESERVLIEYEKDRKRIYKTYKGKSFIDHTLKLLSEGV